MFPQILKVGTSFLALLLFMAPIFGQTLGELEFDAKNAKGTDKIEKLLMAADMALQQNDFDKAFTLSDEAADLAKKLKRPLSRAQALHKSGRALMQTTKRKGLFGKLKPADRFLQSNEVLQEAGVSNIPLVKENLSYLRQIAQTENDQAAIAAIDQQMQSQQRPAKSDIVTSYSQTKGQADVPNSSPSVSNQNENDLVVENRSSATSENLIKQSKALQNLLAEREAAINQMNEGQVKVAFMLLQQRQLLDSLVFRTREDSLSITNQNLALSEAKASRNFSYALAALLLLLSSGVFYNFMKAKKTSKLLFHKNKLIATEKQRSDTLLLNILPASVAEELKSKGSTSARYFDDVGVLFADFVDFTKIAERITPQQLVNDLDTCFRAFDAIIEKYELEKIKTIGDAYLCAGGLNQNGSNQVISIVRAAQEMQAWLTQWNAKRANERLPVYNARIGIHCGPVVAGVVGAQKFAFDIWGDTVNIASRVEQASESGKINLSGAAFKALYNEFPCDFRGKIPVKNKGEIDMYYVAS